jgi:hypothetical protein
MNVRAHKWTAGVRRALVIGGLACVAFLAVRVLYGGGAGRLSRAEPEELARILQAVRAPYRAISRYAEANGSIPVSSEGPEHALYNCRPYVEEGLYYGSDRPTDRGCGPGDASLFDLPHTGLDNGAAHWDEASERLADGDFDYLNEPRALDRGSASYALYAEKLGSHREGRWVVFCNGAALWISRANKHHSSPLGMPRDELMAAELAPVAQPVGALSFNASVGKEWQLLDIYLLLEAYEGDHGHLPLSAEGPEHALYMLKDYAPDPAVFDARYTRLENGAAYYCEESQAVLNGDFDYLNEEPDTSRTWLHRNADPVILADKWGVCGPNVRWVLSASGDWGAVDRRDRFEHADDVLGRDFKWLGASSISGW